MNIQPLNRPWHKRRSYGQRHAHNPIYHTKLWRFTIVPEHKRRSTIWQDKQVSNLLCIECYKQGITTPMHTVDHIVAIEDGGHPTDYANLQSLCLSCHNSKSAREGNNRRHRTQP